MKFSVIHKETGQIFEVYDVVQSRGYAHFLVCEDEQWVYRSAKHFRPLKSQKEEETT